MADVVGSLGRSAATQADDLARLVPALLAGEPEPLRVRGRNRAVERLVAESVQRCSRGRGLVTDPDGVALPGHRQPPEGARSRKNSVHRLASAHDHLGSGCGRWDHGREPEGGEPAPGRDMRAPAVRGERGTGAPCPSAQTDELKSSFRWGGISGNVNRPPSGRHRHAYGHGEVSRSGRPASTDAARTAHPGTMHDLRRVRRTRRSIRPRPS